MATPTVEDILSWPVPDYDNPRDVLDPVVYGVNIPLAVLMTAFMGGRFYSRTILVRGALGPDDWTMLVSYALAMTLTILHIAELRVGIGRHMYDVPPSSKDMVGKMTLITQVLFGPTGALTKISICLTYLRLFPSKFNKWFNYVSIALLAGWGLSTTIVMLLQCRPLPDVWNVRKPKAEKDCINIEAFFIATAVINSVTDVMVYLYPSYYLWQIKMAVAKRVGLIVCFCLGVIVCIAGMIRIWSLVRFFDSWDQTYNGAIVYIFVAVEIDVGITCGCLPGIRPLMAKLLPGTASAADYSGGRGKKVGYSAGAHAQGGDSRGLGRRGVHNHDMGDIRVTQDVELTVSRQSKDGGKKGGSGSADRESEEWNFRN